MLNIHDFDPNAAPAMAELPPLPVGALVVGAYNLLCDAVDLPQPVYLAVSDEQAFCLQFASDQPGLRAITRWAQRFGGVIICEPHAGEDGPESWCRALFDYCGVAVTAYAHVPIPHADYPHLPGRLPACPACEAQCHCTPGDAECVYVGEHNGTAAS